MLSLPEKYCGLINSAGKCFCYGYASDPESGELLYLNIAGAATTVESVWARLNIGKSVSVYGPGLREELGCPNGSLKRFQTKAAEAGVHHLLLVHQSLAEPDYRQQKVSYFFELSEAQRLAMFGYHLQQALNVPVFENWFAPLWVAGGFALRKRCKGEVPMWRLRLDRPAWTKLIQAELAAGRLSFPE